MAERLRRASLARRRRPAMLLLVAGVLLLHALMGWWVAGRGKGGLFDADEGGTEAPPARLQAAFVRELKVQTPSLVAPAVVARPPAATARAARGPASAASAASTPSASSAPDPVAEEAAASSPDASIPPAAAASEALEASAAAAPVDGAAPTTAPAAAPASTAVLAGTGTTDGAFEWPPSTRIDYALTGNYRGEIYGDARVEWVRDGEHYQVHVDTTVGPSFAPLLSRRMTSDGTLGPDGLTPRRYDEQTKRLFSSARLATMRFDDNDIVMANGQRRPRLAGVQDTASQFVQLTWFFTLNPKRLRVGATIEMPLALPRSVDFWVFDVIEEEVLQTPFGPVDSFHLKPRRVARAGGDLTAEIWIAPGLQYLPARIRIRQDEQTYIDLMIERAPLQSLSGLPASALKKEPAP